MASIYRRGYYQVVNGKRVRRYAEKYTIKYKNEDNKWVTTTGFTDKGATKKKATLLETDVEARRRGLVDPFEAPKRQGLAEHVEAFRRSLQSKERTAYYVAQTIKRLRAVLDGCKFTRIADLGAFDATDRVGSYLQERRVTNSAKTVNYYLTAAKAFCRWAAREGRMPPSPVAMMQKLPETEAGRERRTLTAKQFSKLIQAAKAGRSSHGLSGWDRSWLYIVAAYTGLRAAELASLTAESFTKDGILVRPSITKNRERLCQPIPPELQKMLKGYLKRRVGPLWPGKWFKRAAEMIRVDLATADIPYKTDAGVFDFHSLRATYVTNLVSSGINPKIVQTLARHSTIVLTMHNYAKLSAKDSADALRKLPPIPKRS